MCFQTSSAGISGGESGKEDRFQIKLREQGLFRPTAFSFKRGVGGGKQVRAKV